MAGDGDGEPNPVDETGLCLLSLDGGGVRGLSTLYILKGLMTRLNHERQQKGFPAVKPCEVFDLMGGTSTGGLIVIMLGRLEMGVDDCISAYRKLMESVFGEKSSWLPIGWTGGVKAQFDSTKLKNAIEEVITHQGISKTDLLNDGQSRGCKVFVCTTAEEIAGITRLRSYSLPDELDIPATICDAALATSAATGFFDPVSIGARRFVDGALGANNPVDEVEGEASNIWCSETGDLKPLVKCFISIGTGHPGTKAIEDNLLKSLSKTLVYIVTETENSERKFIAKWRQHYNEKRYFRFNVEQGLQRVRLAEYQEEGAIEAATENFLIHQAQKFRVRDCALNLRQKQNKTDIEFAAVVNEYNKRIIRLETNPRKAGWTTEAEIACALKIWLRKSDEIIGTILGARQNGIGGRPIALYCTGLVAFLQRSNHTVYHRVSNNIAYWEPEAQRVYQDWLDAVTQLVSSLNRRLNRTCSFRKELGICWPSAQVDRLENFLFAEDQPSKIAIIGLGGVGKKQVILESVFRAIGSDPDCSILWLPATNAKSLQQAYFEIGQQLGISGIKEERADVKKLVQDHLSQESSGRWLLIFDNADDIEMWIKKDGDGDGFPALKEYLPRSSQGHIIFTTRSRKVAIKLAQEKMIEISEMDERTASLLLSKSLFMQDLSTSHQDSLELLQQLTFLPLAIVQAAAYINENSITFSCYLSLLKEQEQDVIDLLSEDFEDEGQYREKKNPIAITWLVSFEHIRRLYPLAAEYLSFMCCIHPRDIPVSLLPPAQSRKKETDAIGTLSAYSFVSRRSADNALDLHRLVHLATRNWLRREKLLALGTLRVITRLSEVFPDDHPRNRSIWRTYLPHACYVCDSSFIEDGVEKVQLLSKLGKCLVSDGRYNEAEKYLNKLLETHTRMLGEEHPDALITILNLASTYKEQGRLKEAEELGIQVLEIRKRVLGQEHPDTLNSIASLAGTYYEQGRLEEAESLGIQVLESRKTVLGQEHPHTLASISNLARTYWKQGRWREAEKLEVQVMETSKRVLGEENPVTLTSMSDLATTYWNQDQLEEAEQLEVRVLEIMKRVLGEEHPDTLISMRNLAHIWVPLGRHIEALQLMEKCLELRNQKLGTDHPDTIDSWEKLEVMQLIVAVSAMES